MCNLSRRNRLQTHNYRVSDDVKCTRKNLRRKYGKSGTEYRQHEDDNNNSTVGPQCTQEAA